MYIVLAVSSVVSVVVYILGCKVTEKMRKWQTSEQFFVVDDLLSRYFGE